MKRIYIAGPMTGKPDLNRDEFYKAAKRLGESKSYFEVIDPHGVAIDEFWDEETPLSEVASVLLGLLTNCDAIYMLRGWEQSKGATAEHAVAKWIGLEIIYQGESE